MAGASLTDAQIPVEPVSEGTSTERLRGLLGYVRRNPSLLVGIVLLLGLFLFSGIGSLVYDISRARALSVTPGQPPSAEFPFGTDMQGRDLLAVMMAGTPLTLRIGLIAGFLGVSIGAVLAFVAGYYGGTADTLIRGVVDIGLTVPSLLVLIIIAVSLHVSLSVDQMALVIASLAWLWPARTIRAQVLSLRERGYVQVARMSGRSSPEIIFLELLPNLLPYLAASLVGSTASAILASIGLEALGLGPMEAPTLGMTIYWVIRYAALLLGMWWWFIPPIVIIIILFMALFNLSTGLDEIADPRLRRSTADLPKLPKARGPQVAVPDGRRGTGILRVQGLRVYYYTLRGAVKAVDGVSLSLQAGERLGLVGESGSGKSSMALSIMRMIKPPGRTVGGAVWLDGRNLLDLPEDEMQRLRLAEIALIAQGSMNSLNPVLRIGDQIVDGLRDHDVPMTPQEMDARVRDLLEWVGLRPEVASMFPHELSGGMKQRVCIAMAISLRPKVIIADEPTSALDVVVQRQVMETLQRVQEDLGAAVILVSHDMGLMAQFVDRLGVMYAGRLVEVAPVKDIFTKPRHPYTQLLIASLPSLEQKGEFRGIPGLPPSLLDLPPGCAFHPRCPYATDRCRTEQPALREVQPNVRAACHLL